MKLRLALVLALFLAIVLPTGTLATPAFAAASAPAHQRQSRGAPKLRLLAALRGSPRTRFRRIMAFAQRLAAEDPAALHVTAEIVSVAPDPEHG